MPRTRVKPIEVEGKYEPYLKTGQVMELFGVAYASLSKWTKPDPNHPDRPVLRHLRVGRQMRFRYSDVEDFFARYARWTDEQK